MEENTQLELGFPSVCGKKVVADFEGGVVTSDAGLLHNRDQRYVDHRMRELLTQRVLRQTCSGSFYTARRTC